MLSLVATDRPGVGTVPETGESVEGLFRGNFAEISPDGRYLAYQSDESGRMEVHVRPFPQVESDRWQFVIGNCVFMIFFDIWVQRHPPEQQQRFRPVGGREARLGHCVHRAGLPDTLRGLL